MNLDVSLYHGGFHGDVNGTVRCFRPPRMRSGKELTSPAVSRRRQSVGTKPEPYQNHTLVSGRVDPGVQARHALPRRRGHHRADREGAGVQHEPDVGLPSSLASDTSELMLPTVMWGMASTSEPP